MEEYINKSALVAEIEKRIKETESMQPKFDQFWAGQISAFKGVLKILNTLEVKEVVQEVDLDAAVERYIGQHKGELRGYFDIDSTKPATKEQRDLLFRKMKESGYEWSDKDRKLIKIVK